MARKAVIISGGFGTRLAPRTTLVPKQFQDLLGAGRTMIQLTAERLAPLADGDITVVTSDVQARWVREQLPGARIVREPAARNTGPAIGLAAITMEEHDVMLVAWADHVFGDEDALRDCWSRAADLAASHDLLVTIGIEPAHPHTGLGHIERGEAIAGARDSYRVLRFVEKPPLDKAREYTASGRFYWNAGIFAWSAGKFLACVRKHRPHMYEGLQAIKGGGDVSAIFPALPNISVDYAVMEHAADETAVIAGKGLGWLDIGDWAIWGQAIGPDEAGNARQGRVVLEDCRGCIAYNDDPRRPLQIVGLRDAIVVSAEGRLLISPVQLAQQVGKAADILSACAQTELNLGIRGVSVMHHPDRLLVASQNLR